MLIGHLRTGVIEKHLPNLPAEGGQFEMKITIPEPEISASGSPWSFVSREIAIHLQQAILDTTVPREFWVFYPTTEIQRRFELPTNAIPMGN